MTQHWTWADVVRGTPPEGRWATLPNELVDLLGSWMEGTDHANFLAACSRFYTILDDERSKQCGEDVHDAIHRCEEQAMWCHPVDRIPSHYEKLGRPDDGVWEVEEEIVCTRTDHWHNVKCRYVRYSRDVDLLSWWVDGEQQGYTMM